MAATGPEPRGQRALVTGASGGIGLELARVLAREGCHLVISARTPSALETVARDLSSAYNVAVHTVAADLASADGARALMAEVASAGLDIDLLVNNAGFGLFGAFAATSLEDEQRMIDLNISALVTLTKLCLPGMLARRRGRVLNVASTAAFLPGPNMAVYYATKAFVLSFSEAIADELRAHRNRIPGCGADAEVTTRPRRDDERRRGGRGRLPRHDLRPARGHSRHHESLRAMDRAADAAPRGDDSLAPGSGDHLRSGG
jgi:NADP-dependent 3-hydroxy acid dehydrogenase YdfG